MIHSQRVWLFFFCIFTINLMSSMSVILDNGHSATSTYYLIFNKINFSRFELNEREFKFNEIKLIRTRHILVLSMAQTKTKTKIRRKRIENNKHICTLSSPVNDTKIPNAERINYQINILFKRRRKKTQITKKQNSYTNYCHKKQDQNVFSNVCCCFKTKQF